jgi:hypothetical protein
MTPDFAGAARSLVTMPTGESTSRAIAERALDAYEQLFRPLSRLIGDTGVRTLFARSLSVASSAHPWLASAVAVVAADVDGTRAVRAALESQVPEAAVTAFVDVLSTLVALLERLIGERLVSGLLHEVWPTVFAVEAKESP